MDMKGKWIGIKFEGIGKWSEKENGKGKVGT